MGVLEYESVLVFILIALDIIVGSINHIFKLKDNVSSIASESLANKCVQVVCVLAMLLVVHSNDFGLFKNVEIAPVKNTCRTLFATIIVAFLYYELTSVLKHISIITGIDLTIIPGVKSELNDMHEKLYTENKIKKEIDDEEKKTRLGN